MCVAHIADYYRQRLFPDYHHAHVVAYYLHKIYVEYGVAQ